MFKRILVPVDFSASSKRGLDFAVELARPLNAEVILVHAVENPYVGIGELYGQVYDTSALLEEFSEAGKKGLARLAAQIAKKHVRSRRVLDIGTAHDVIVEAARRLKADLIVLSTHGRSGLAHVLLGSVAEKVIRHATCPVLTVRGLKTKTRAAAPLR